MPLGSVRLLYCLSSISGFRMPLLSMMKYRVVRQASTDGLFNAQELLLLLLLLLQRRRRRLLWLLLLLLEVTAEHRIEGGMKVASLVS